jgi:HEAT repeat protein
MRYFIFGLAVLGFLGQGTYGQPPIGNKGVEQKSAGAVVGGKTLFEWQKDLKDKDPSIREKAISVLKFYRAAARDSVPDLVKALTDPDISLRVNAVITLGYVGFEEKDREHVISGLIRCLHLDQQGIVKFQALRALGLLGQDAVNAVPRIASLIKDKTSWEVRAAAAYALGTTSLDPKKGMAREGWTALMAGIKDTCLEVRRQSILSLIVLGPPPRNENQQELQDLKRIAANKSEHEKVRIWARVCIMRISSVSEEHLVAIARYLRSEKADVRIESARALATVGKDAKSRKDDLCEALKDKEAEVRAWSASALGSMGKDVKECAPALQILKNDQDPVVRQAAIDALDKIAAK